MGDPREEFCISEDNLQLIDSTTNSCNAEIRSVSSNVQKDEDDSDDKKTYLIPSGYRCVDCSKYYRRVQLLFKHTNEQHGGRKCPECDKRFASNSPYNIHIIKHTSLRYSCIKCGHEFYSKSSLITHTNAHLGIKPYKCAKCEKSFSDRSACIRHEKLHSRGGEFETTCSVCGKGLAMAARLEEHMKTHGSRKFSQEEKLEAVSLARELGVRQASDKLQVLTTTLANWVKLVTRPVPCTQCSYTTYTTSRLGEHMRSMHNSGGKKLPRDFHLPNYGLRPFPCQLCAVRSKNKKSLKKHMQRAHGHENIKTEDNKAVQDVKALNTLGDHLKEANQSASLSSDKITDKTSDTTLDNTSDNTLDNTSDNTLENTLDNTFRNTLNKAKVEESKIFSLGPHTSVTLEQFLD